MEISRHKVRVKSYKSNGRVKRNIRTIRGCILKSKKRNFTDKLKEAVKNYNLSFHSEVGGTPIKAENGKSEKGMVENRHKVNMLRF